MQSRVDWLIYGEKDGSDIGLGQIVLDGCFTQGHVNCTLSFMKHFFFVLLGLKLVVYHQLICLSLTSII